MGDFATYLALGKRFRHALLERMLEIGISEGTIVDSENGSRAIITEIFWYRPTFACFGQWMPWQYCVSGKYISPITYSSKARFSFGEMTVRSTILVPSRSIHPPAGWLDCSDIYQRLQDFWSGHFARSHGLPVPLNAPKSRHHLRFCFKKSHNMLQELMP